MNRPAADYARIVAALAFATVALACTTLAPSPTASLEPTPPPLSSAALLTTCASWLGLGTVGAAPGEETGAQVALAAAMVQAEGLLEGVRLAQGQSPGTPQETLERQAAASVTKNCQAPGQLAKTVLGLLRQLYR